MYIYICIKGGAAELIPFIKIINKGLIIPKVVYHSMILQMHNEYKCSFRLTPMHCLDSFPQVGFEPKQTGGALHTTQPDSTRS